MTPALEPVRRIAAYGVCTDDDGRVLLVRAAPGSGTPGVVVTARRRRRPRRAPARHRRAGDGRRDRPVGGGEPACVDVLADMRALPNRGVTIHTDRLIYAVTVRGGALRDRIGQPTDLARWLSPAEAGALPLRPFTATALGLPAGPGRPAPGRAAGVPVVLRRAGAGRPAPGAALRRVRRRHRPGRPGAAHPHRAPATRAAGSWHLPGGGTDFGEQPGHRAAARTGRGDRAARRAGRAARAWRATATPPRSAPRATRSTGTACGRSTGSRSPSRRRWRCIDAGGSTDDARWHTVGECAGLAAHRGHRRGAARGRPAAVSAGAAASERPRSAGLTPAGRGARLVRAGSAAYGLAATEPAGVLLVRAGRRPLHPATSGRCPAAPSRTARARRRAVARRRPRADRADRRGCGPCATATADQVTRPDGVTVHNDRLLFDLSVPLRPRRPAVDARRRALVRAATNWPDPAARLRRAMRSAAARRPGRRRRRTRRRLGGRPRHGPRRHRPRLRVQRFSTYALATDPAGRVLLARIAPGYPGAGRWHLPGGGTDVGEAPADGAAAGGDGGDRPARPGRPAAQRVAPAQPGCAWAGRGIRSTGTRSGSCTR